MWKAQGLRVFLKLVGMVYSSLTGEKSVMTGIRMMEMGVIGIAWLSLGLSASLPNAPRSVEMGSLTFCKESSVMMATKTMEMDAIMSAELSLVSTVPLTAPEIPSALPNAGMGRKKMTRNAMMAI